MLYKDYVERKVSNAIRINSAEGYPCVFDNSKGRPLKDYKLYGNSIQDGTPTPESPVEVQSVGDLVTDAASEYYGKYDIPIVVNDTTTHIYLDEPLRKVGSYADYIDFKRGKIVRNVTAGVLDGSEGWSISGTRYYYYNTKLNIKCLGNEVTGIKSNALPSVAWNWIRNSGTGIATYSGATGGAYNNRIDIRADSLWKNVAEAKEYMANNPIHYIAPCLEPAEEDIELPKIFTQKGSNIITVATEIEPSYIEVKYIAK